MLDRPLLLRPLLKARVWGGSRLASYGRAVEGSEPIGESWEVADLPETVTDGRSVVASGPLAGRTLHEIMQSDREALLGAAQASNGAFPLLIKFLDAREPLSVQVHPDEAYAAAHPGAALKSEAWYIVEAEPGAVIYRGLRDGVTRESFRAALDAGTVVECLREIPVRAGDCHYLPGGTCHALGGGLLVAEVQTPSDTTFRVHDWGRTGRQLHIEEAMACIDFSDSGSSGAGCAASPPLLTNDGAIGTTTLVRTDHFGLERIDAAAGQVVPVVTNGQAEIWMLLDGAGRIEASQGPTLMMERGSTVVFPASVAATSFHVETAAHILRVTLPSPLRGMIA